MEKLEYRPTTILLLFWMIGIVIACIPIAGLSSMASIDTGISWQYAVVAGFIIPLILFSLYAILYFRSIRYELDDRYITKASGVLWKQRRSIPLGKITNIDVRQGPFERMFGYGKVWIFTPSTGAATPEEKIIGITHPHNLKQIIIDRSETAKSSPVSTSQDKNSVPSDNTISLLTEIRDSLKRIEENLCQQNKLSS